MADGAPASASGGAPASVPFAATGSGAAAAQAHEPPSGADRGWRAELALRFARDAGGATRLSDRRHTGPLVVQRPFYPEGREIPHVYVLHPPGGVVGGDRLSLDVALGTDAHALLTTPAATKLYRTAGALATVTQTLTVGQGGALEWLPHENILHDGARALLSTRVTLGKNARFIGIDTLCFGLPARGETFASGRCRQAFEIWRDDHPIFIERGRFDAADPVQGAAWGLAGERVHGLMAITPAPAGADSVDGLRAAAAAVADAGRGRAAVTILDHGDVLVARYLGHSAPAAREFFQRLWTMMRPKVFGRAAVAPRIWAT